MSHFIIHLDGSKDQRLWGKIKCTTSAGGHRKFSYKDIIDFSKRNKIYLKSVEDLSVIDNSKIVNKILFIRSGSFFLTLHGSESLKYLFASNE